jgi:hypothetical protein
MVRGENRIIAVPPSIRCVNAFLSRFYGAYWLLANENGNKNSDKCSTAASTLKLLPESLANSEVDDELKNSGFYSGPFGEERAQSIAIVSAFLRRGESTNIEICCIVRQLYCNIFDTLVKNFFYDDYNSFVRYIEGNGILRSGPNNILINVPFCFNLMEKYRIFEKVLENICESYVQLDGVCANTSFSEDVKMSLLFLMPTSEKMMKIFNKIGCRDDVIQFVIDLNSQNLPLDETRRYVCEICTCRVLNPNLLLAINYMGLSPDAQKGLWIVFHESVFPKGKLPEENLNKIREEFAVCPNLPTLGFVETPQH